MSSNREIQSDLLIRIDSVCSLVAYRYGSDLPRDVRQELIDVSWAARRLYEGRTVPDDQ